MEPETPAATSRSRHLARRWLLPALLVIAPLWPGLLITAVSLKVEEQYPFSHFPMYRNFSDLTYYVYVADGEGEPIAVQSLTYNRTTRLRKIYDDELEPIRLELRKRRAELTPEERRPAGEYALHWLVENSPPHGQRALREIGTLRFYHVNVTVVGDAVGELDHELIAEIQVPAADDDL